MLRNGAGEGPDFAHKKLEEFEEASLELNHRIPLDPDELK